MGWPDLESFIPAPLRGGPVPRDVLEPAQAQLREAWRRYVARRVHGAEERAIALVEFSNSAPFALLFDGRTLEIATPVSSSSEAAAAVSGLPRSGMIMRQGGVAIWRESLSDDQAAARWRDLGGDEAFALPLPTRSGTIQLDGWTGYAIVRRGADQVRVELGSEFVLAPDVKKWIARYAPYLRADVRAALIAP